MVATAEILKKKKKKKKKNLGDKFIQPVILFIFW
jgi:hypothetical protein